MNAYVDTSVVIRILFGEPNPLPEWRAIDHAFTSTLTRVEALRVIDRARLGGDVDDDDVVLLRGELFKALRSMTLVRLTDALMHRAAQPMPTVIGTLDALHLVTAAAISEHLEPALVVATHDEQLARAARALGLVTCGQ